MAALSRRPIVAVAVNVAVNVNVSEAVEAHESGSADRRRPHRPESSRPRLAAAGAEDKMGHVRISNRGVSP